MTTKTDLIRPGWCEEHSDFGWRYYDGSGGCFYACVVEMGSSECRLVPAVLTVKGKRMKRVFGKRGD